MKYLSRIVFIPNIANVAILLFVGSFAYGSYSFSQADHGWGNLTGQIIVDGKAPAPAALTVDKDRTFCLRDQSEIADPSLIIGKEGELKDAFVMLSIARGQEAPPVHESYLGSADAKIVLDNVKCRFEPYAVFLRTSQTLAMKNSDEVGHNCHIVLFNNEINANIPIGETVETQLKKSERVPGPVKCDIHPWMSAVILVRDEPYAAITDAEGRFTIANLPAGEWTFQFWHSRVGYIKNLTQDGKKIIDQRRNTVNFTIVPNETLDLGTLKIPASDLSDKK
ncbi:MAG TPA: carboxypeptidase regulatory-like domain-containing protein [Pirellulaceae bacterium]|nr:carboxypeptidase regulatory-like domain-containing protein [Pirellulaceae bacterium]HMO92452.1 carboxypeptidase regulatory-like domain-containing protein [Pirellulaceae bacterium]HMP67878.1 carboxypeptidase regulatory-like domain-containing protein [Pirellulaceae bacterium]